jgi:beta-barrel assembly-enhancing protease
MSTGFGAATSAIANPVIRTLPGSIAKKFISDDVEKALGDVLAEQIEKEFTISQDPELNKRLQDIGEKMAENSKRPGLDYTFKVIDDDTINAFAGPGGKIYVHKGLMDEFSDDAHLAFIVGHEMGHVENRDPIEKLGYSSYWE